MLFIKPIPCIFIPLCVVSLIKGQLYDRAGVPCGDKKYERITYEIERDPGAVSTIHEFACGIKNGFPCPQRGVGESSCAGPSTCEYFLPKEFDESIDDEDEVSSSYCHCKPRNRARINSMCSSEPDYKSSLFFTLLILPYESGLVENEYLNRMKELAKIFDEFEVKMKYSEPGQNAKCPYELSQKVEEAIDYFSSGGFLEQSMITSMANILRSAVKELGTGESFCDYRYPMKCSTEGFCVLSIDDVFVKSTMSSFHNHMSSLIGVNVWLMEYLEGEICRSYLKINPKLSPIYQNTLQYVGCTKNSICKLVQNATKDEDAVSKCVRKEGIIIPKPTIPSKVNTTGGLSEGTTESSSDNRQTSPPECQATNDPSLIRKAVDSFNENRIKRSTLEINAACNFTTVNEIQKLLKLDTIELAAVSLENDQNWLTVCIELSKLVSEGMCNPRKLLYCNEENRCVCMKNSELTLNEKDCALIDFHSCGKSWIVDGTNNLLGLPSDSPSCASGKCHTSKSSEGRELCKEDFWGLILVEMEEDEESNAYSLKASEQLVKILSTILIVRAIVLFKHVIN